MFSGSELEKYTNIFEDRKVIIDFLEWLDKRQNFICCYLDPEQELAWPVPISETQQQLLDEYFEIDPVQLEKERRELLEEAREDQRRWTEQQRT